MDGLELEKLLTISLEVRKEGDTIAPAAIAAKKDCSQLTVVMLCRANFADECDGFSMNGSGECSHLLVFDGVRFCGRRGSLWGGVN